MTRTLFNPPVIRPQSFTIPRLFGKWCKLDHVIAMAKPIAEDAGVHIRTRPADFITDFVVLTIPDAPVPITAKHRGRKIFRYVLDIDPKQTLHEKEVFYDAINMPPRIPFSLDIDDTFLPQLNVPEPWAMDTLTAIHKGASRVIEWENGLVGYYAKMNPPAHVPLKRLLYSVR